MIDDATYQRYSTDPVAFISDLLIDVSGTVHRWGEVMDQFQRDDFAKLAPGMLVCAGRSDNPAAKLRFWGERPRGASKSTDIAAVCAWLLIFATRPLKIGAWAADREQAAILKAAAATIIRLNPWLGDLLTVEQHRVVLHAVGHPGDGAQLTIESSDAATSYGALNDACVADEICHWQEKAGSELFASVISTVAKRANCLFFGITNSGFVDSFAWKVREAIRLDPAWIFSRLEGQASWMTEERLAEQRRLLPPVAFARLWLNQWSSGGGDALTPEDIAAAFRNDQHPMRGNEPGWLFVAGVDLGLTRDGSAVVVLAVAQGGIASRIRLAHHQLWRPTDGRKIDLMEIERHMLALDEQYGLQFVGADPWQAELLCQRLEADSGHRRRNQRRRYASQPWVRAIPPTAANLREQAALTIECFQDHRVQLFDCNPLRRDLQRLRVEEKNSGFRLVSPRDADGHGDSASAFCLALLLAHEIAGKKPVRAGALLSNGTSNLEKQLSAWQRRQDDYQAEMKLLAAARDDDADPMKHLRLLRR